jgi:hypothetical protein
MPGPTTPDSIDNYRPKKQRGWLIGIGAVVIAIAATLVIVNYLPAAPEPTPTPRPTAYATPTRAGGVAFKNSVVQGYWKVTDTTWTPETVRLSLEITVDRGTLYYDLHAYQADGTTAVDPTWTDATDLKPGFVGPGETITGTLTFAVPRQRLTLVMATRDQAQLSALVVTG